MLAVRTSEPVVVVLLTLTATVAVSADARYRKDNRTKARQRQAAAIIRSVMRGEVRGREPSVSCVTALPTDDHAQGINAHYALQREVTSSAVWDSATLKSAFKGLQAVLRVHFAR